MITTIIIAVASIIYRHKFLLGRFIGEHEEFKDNVKKSFQNLRDDIKELKRE